MSTGLRQTCDEVSDEAVVRLRLELVLKLSDVVAAEDTWEQWREVFMGVCDVFGGREGHQRGRSAGQCGHVFINHQAVFQPEMKPGTFRAGEPGTLAKGLDAGLGLSLGVTLGEGLGETLAETAVLTRDEV
jgi:hypothetical protein